MDHVVKPGETLSDICKRYNVNVEEVLQLNRHIKEPDKLRQGQVVTLPPPTVIVEPEIQRLVPAGARVVAVREVAFTRRRPRERLLIVILRDGINCVIVLRFIAGIGWRIIFQRCDFDRPIRILETGTLLEAELEQAVIGAITGVNNDLSFSVLGSRNDDEIEVLLDRMHETIPQGTVNIHEGRLEVSSPTQIRRFTWDGGRFVETIHR
ncbi:MAG: LysM peptidoglycan-binding domain-containing protein [Bacillota bacterium]